MSRLGIDFAQRFGQLTPEQEEAVQLRLQQAKAREASNRASDCERALSCDLGRYAGLSLDDYECYHENQTKVLSRVRNMAKRIDELITRRLNVIWWGTIGTGKDYMATWLLREAATHGHSVRWLPARNYYDECSAAFADGSTQRDVYRMWSKPTVVCLSDPVYEDGWNAKNSEYLNRLVRRRYDAGRATWLTANIILADKAGSQDFRHAVDLFGADVWDRLAESAVLLECRWPSNRTREA